MFKKRLGGERYQRVIEQFDLAMQCQLQTSSTKEHQGWIKILLAEYYDPMYDYQMQQNKQDVLFKGSISEVVEYLK